MSKLVREWALAEFAVMHRPGICVGIIAAGVLTPGHGGVVLGMLGALVGAFGLGCKAMARTALDLNELLRQDNRHLRAHLRREQAIRRRMIARTRERATTRRDRGSTA